MLITCCRSSINLRAKQIRSPSLRSLLTILGKWQIKSHNKMCKNISKQVCFNRLKGNNINFIEKRILVLRALFVISWSLELYTIDLKIISMSIRYDCLKTFRKNTIIVLLLIYFNSIKENFFLLLHYSHDPLDSDSFPRNKDYIF